MQQIQLMNKVPMQHHQQHYQDHRQIMDLYEKNDNREKDVMRMFLLEINIPNFNSPIS